MLGRRACDKRARVQVQSHFHSAVQAAGATVRRSCMRALDHMRHDWAARAHRSNCMPDPLLEERDSRAGQKATADLGAVVHVRAFRETDTQQVCPLQAFGLFRCKAQGGEHVRILRSSASPSRRYVSAHPRCSSTALAGRFGEHSCTLLATNTAATLHTCTADYEARRLRPNGRRTVGTPSCILCGPAPRSTRIQSWTDSVLGRNQRALERRRHRPGATLMAVRLRMPRSSLHAVGCSVKASGAPARYVATH